MAIFKPADILIPQNVDFKSGALWRVTNTRLKREYWEDVKKYCRRQSVNIEYYFP